MPSIFAAQEIDNMLLMKLKDGEVIIILDEQKAPQTVKRIKELVKTKFYDGVPFHRVIKDFMAQTGDPTGTGRGGSGKNIPFEKNDLKHVRGAVSMARAADINSADSQFFIVLKDTSYLDNNYTVFGRVAYGMEQIDKIKNGDEKNNGMVINPDKIISLSILTNEEYTRIGEELKSKK